VRIEKKKCNKSHMQNRRETKWKEEEKEEEEATSLGIPASRKPEASFPRATTSPPQ
jgi:hypothetical protein